MLRRRVVLLLTAGFLIPTVSAQQEAQPTFLTTPADVVAYHLAAVRNLNYIPGEVIVKFREGTTVAGQARAMDVLRSRPLPDRLRWIADRTARLAVEGDADSPAIAASLARQPEVEYAHPNWLMKLHATPNDTGYSLRQWNMTTLNMPAAWDINTGTNITVAVIDTGVTTVTQSFDFKTWSGSAIVTDSMPVAVNPDFDPARLLPGRDFVFWNGPVIDFEGHGTHVSGTVAQWTNNSLGFAGIAYNAKIMPLKTCLGYWDIQILGSTAGLTGFAPPGVGGCTTSAIISAIRYAADNGANIINLSLGSTTPSQATLEALNYAVSKGVFIAMSSGNEFEEGNPATYPASYAPTVAGAMAVGAIGRSLTRAPYSTTGSFVEIVAPGGNGLDGGTAGRIWQAGLFEPDSDPFTVIFPRFDRYGDIAAQGTSMASPHVAGIAALLMSQGITSPAAIEAIITRTARDLGAAGKDNDFGYGLIEPRAALRGFGVVR